ncbi:MAG: GEVED domain-containing protein [Euryarchaeota archaeon]|nr:GEVED domain-containing protein [Euryarchaeota archaeon]
MHFWGSWKDDKKGKIRNIRLSIHSDDPVGLGGSDKENKFSKPDEQLWKHDFGPDEFEEMLYYTVPRPGEWWWDPASREGAIPGGDTQVWRYDIKIDPDEAFFQNGTVERPTIYWLYIVVETESEEYEFGWKTREWPDHFMDDAVWDYGSELPRFWKELRYPLGHPYHELERNSIDMAFALTFEGIETLDWGDAPDGMAAPGYPTLATSNGARHTIVPGLHLGRTIRISQESAPGLGDFDANVLGYVSPYVTTNTTAGYYQYGTPYGASFNGPAPPLTSNRSHLFLADTADGLSLFAVHDKPEDGCGGTARMKWTLAGDTAGVLALDDPTENVTVSGGGTIFESSHGWMPCCTDGMALGSLDGGWAIAGAFTNAIDKTGMDEWHVHSSDGSSIALAFERDLRVRLDYQRPIDPDPDGQPDPNALGDDNDGNDDENGVVFNTPLAIGQPATVTVTASTQGILQGWIDFNADRDWADSGEQIFVNKPLVAGPNVLTFNVPVTSAQADAFVTFARFRFSRMRDLSFEGPARDGEVEDYMVRIEVRPTADLGDAPDSTNSFPASMTAYPGVQANFPTVYGAGSPPHGPIHRQPKALAFLGQSVSLESEADIGPDEDGCNNLEPRNDAADLDVSDDGVNMPLVLVHCEPNTFDYVVTVVDPLYRSVYVNVWFDWNRDGDWDDTMKCPGDAGTVPVLAPEWAVQNQQLHLSGPGIFTFTTPRFMAWLPPQVEAEPPARWMRITLSERKWGPFAGVHGVVTPNSGGSGPAGGYQYGETEDYCARCIQSPPNTKWVQLPDLTPNGINIKVDDMRILADDFECTSPSLLTDVHFWGSWKHDDKGEIKRIHLRIHSDDPAGSDGTDQENRFSKPDKQLWERDFGPDEFEESLYYTATDRGEWWWDPAGDEKPIPECDKQVWRYDIKIKPDEAFLQRGTRERPIIYWLDIRVTTADGEFGWKTRQWSDHFMDDAVWDYGSKLPRTWNELRYPEGHPYHGLERDSIDMAFMLTFEALDWGDAPDPRYPTLTDSNGASHIIDPDVCLGRWVEADEDGQPSAGAIGDDIIDGTDDEDGVAIPPLRAGATTRINALASVNGYLNAWFDWNADGDWDDEGEYVISERPIPAGPSLHNIRVPYDAKPGGSYARFRFSTKPLAKVLPEPLYEGRAPDGEVEDYRFYVRPAGPDHFEPNDDFGAAFDLGSLNQNRTGLGIHEPGEEDWFKWTALNAGPVNFNVTGNVTLELYDSDGNKLATTGPDKCIPWDVMADESYYVRVRAAESHMTVLDYGWLVKLLGDSDNYALLFSGGSTPGYNYNRYYNNIKEMYETLADDYDVPPGNIWILYADGTNPAADQPGGVNSDMTYITNGTTVMSGTRANLESVLTTTLPGLVDGNDHFLFYAFDHGGGADNAPATTGEEVLTGWSASTSDDDLKDWLNQVGAGHATVVHTQCFAGGMLDDLLPVTTSTFGCAATNHYEGSWGDGFAGAFAGALKTGYGNAYDAYVYAHDHDTYAITRGTYPDNGGTWIYGKEHPWAASTANFPIFAEEDNLLPQLKEDDMYLYPEFYIDPPYDPLRITHDMFIAQELFMNDAPGMGFRIEAVNSGSLTKNGEPVVPGKTMIRYGESVVWTPPAPVNSAEESGGADVFDAFTIRAADGATVSDNSATITISTDLAGELVAVDDIVEIDEDERDVIIDALANDSGNGTLVVAGVGQPQRGVALLAEGQVSYMPGPNFYGSDQFTYSVIDSALNTGTATVTVMVRSVNDPPEAYDDHLTVVMDSVNNTIDVLVNDYDVDPDPLTALPGNSPAHGSVIPNADGIFSYTPDAGYTGSDSFTYLADDGTDQSMATVMITVVEDADSDWGDAPEFSSSMGGGYPTRAASGGASHTIGGPWLGAMAPDGEADGQPDSAAMGDDNNNIDDEDGITIPDLAPGKTATIEIVVGGGGGHVDAWIDWNGNHLWEHPQEQIHAEHLSDGTHTISVSAPDASITGQTFARFRISSDGGLTPMGSAPDGEVEDYMVQIQASQGYCECGDLNCDGEVTTADAVIALEMAAGIRPNDLAADVDGDGRVTSLDALMILQAAAGLIEIC